MLIISTHKIQPRQRPQPHTIPLLNVQTQRCHFPPRQERPQLKIRLHSSLNRGVVRHTGRIDYFEADLELLYCYHGLGGAGEV